MSVRLKPDMYARSLAFGCMTRVGITPPAVTITADDKRLKAGKPAPDPFLLAASELGFDAKRCVVFEDSPSGIRAGVASGATVIALCTSVSEGEVDGLMGQLVLAVESEGTGGGVDGGAGGAAGDVGRVREFLRRVEMVI